MLNQIRAMHENFSKSEKKVAEIILEQPHQYVNATINQLAGAADVSEPTIVRFCRTLKLAGYREFRLRLTQDLASQIHYQHRNIDATDSADALIDKVFSGAIACLSSVRNQLIEAVVDAAISLLSESQRIEIYGVGGAAIVVNDAQLKFARLGLNVQPYCDSYLQRVAAGMLDAHSCVLAISNSGRSKDLIASIKLAKASGAKIISITASASPLAALSHLHLAIDLDEDDDYLVPIKARIAHMAVVDTLAIGLAVRCKPAYLERLRQANLVLVDKFETRRRKR
ncbi:MAG: RpiR family carbohydrate utilization transcriptional regulator [Gammaproteobacteria bacterium]|jgi:RpiR family carbohydrate utilization transcriptional regulator